ncbi:MAG: hypothetical protein SGJ13_00995, partial [Actinomycetota bacterium]|nr:hypothetical protein [Actinomycetota bacterium]
NVSGGWRAMVAGEAGLIAGAVHAFDSVASQTLASFEVELASFAVALRILAADVEHADRWTGR